MRFTFIYIALSISISLNGQSSLKDDTIKITEVLIRGRNSNSDYSGYKKLTIDSSVIKEYSHSSLAELLSDNSNVFIKSYGMGGVATPSFRGTGASHTQIEWNGLNINHPMLGQSDLSIVPSGLIDDIKIYFGGASMNLNSGGIGGVINLETGPVWKKETLLQINPGLGSFGQYSGLVKVRSGSVNFQTVTKAFFQSSNNNFKYLNSEAAAVPFWETRTHSEVVQKGFIQELYCKVNKNIFAARIWYQSGQRNLPPSMLTQQSNARESQSDESLRSMLSFDGYRGSSKLNLTGALMFDRLNYLNELASIDSRNNSESAVLKGSIENRIGKNLRYKIALDEQIIVVRTNNYEKNISRNTASVSTLIERKNSDRVGATVLIRQIYDRNRLLAPDFSAGFQFRLTDEKESYLKANLSRNSKIPGMNDLYWMPGGNSGLKNEYAMIYELGYLLSQKISDPLFLKYDLTFYHNSIKDMILWHPGNFSYWTADNMEKVKTSGIESSFVLDYTYNGFKSKLTGAYSYTRAVNFTVGNNESSKGKQLMYIPENQYKGSFRISYKMIYSSWGINYTGKRFIAVDDSKYLPGYILNNLIAGINIPVKETSIDFNFTINNLFDVKYQSIAYYPLPGRFFNFKILVQILK